MSVLNSISRNRDPLREPLGLLPAPITTRDLLKCASGKFRIHCCSFSFNYCRLGPLLNALNIHLGGGISREQDLRQMPDDRSLLGIWL